MKFINNQNEEIELTRLVSLTNYAKKEGIHYTTARYRVFGGDLETVNIDGTLFIVLPAEEVKKKRKMNRKKEVESV